MSESYGDCEKDMGASGVQFYGSLWEQAAAQGISVFVSSGDSGAAGCDNAAGPAANGLGVNGIASTPYNAAVGGTDFNQYNRWSAYWSSTNTPVTNQSVLGYIPETAWDDSCTNWLLPSVGGSTSAEANCNNAKFSSFLNSFGGGGGVSSIWLKPAWQTGTPGDNARDLPDVSLFSSNGFLGSYYLVCQSDAYNGCLAGVGGTSVASAQFAGIMALIDQKAGSAQGVPGLTLYKLAAQQPSAFHDIPAGSTIATPCKTGTANCTTTNPGDAYGVLSGYATAAGYDLATGLGSIDAANLVNRWQTVSFSPSTTTLSVNGGSRVNITHGAAVPFSVSVSPSAATGQVALMVAPGTPGDPGIAAFPLTSGSVTSSTALLPGGNYSLLAHYGGDSNYGGSYSSSVPVTVLPEPGKVLVNLVTANVNGLVTSYSASGATYGSGYALLRVDVGDANATVSPSAGISSLCASRKESCPTGKVTFTAPGTSLNGNTLMLNSDGSVETAAPPAGTYSIAAAYSGDASFAPGNGTASFTIAKAPTAATASTQTNPSYGAPIAVTSDVTSTSLGVAPTGTVQFSIDGSPISAASFITTSSSYKLSNNVPQYAYADFEGYAPGLGVGTHTLSTAYSGDANYAAATSPPMAFTVTKGIAPFFIDGLTTPPGGLVVGDISTVSAYVGNAPYGARPTGTVAFYDNGTLIPGTATYSVQPSGQAMTASIQVAFPAVGTHLLTAIYSGDANYTSENTTGWSVQVLGPVSITQSGAVVVPTPGQPGSTTLTITPNGGFTGTVSLACTPDPKASETICGFTSGANSGSTLQVTIGASATTATFNITTTAPHTIAKLNALPFGPAATVALAGVFALFLPVRKRYRNLSFSLIAIVMALGLGACGGSSGAAGGSGGNGGGNSNIDPGTPVGQYSFNVTATTGSGASQIVVSAPITVNVN